MRGIAGSNPWRRPELITGFLNSHRVRLGRGGYVLSDGSALTIDAEHPGAANRHDRG